MPLEIAVSTSIFVSQLTPCGAADEIVAFGLTNRSINLAEISLDTEYQELHVGDLAELGYKGVSVRLGEAESGLFFAPYTHASLENGNFMAGHAYGRSLNIERRLVSVYCQRTDWATFPVTVDFLPLGTTSKTVQIFVDHILVGEETYTDGTITISSSNSDSLGARVNPFWRMPDGSIGVLIEFTQSIPPIYLPSGSLAYATHLFIRANRPLVTVDYVSRVDIYGGGGLSHFAARDERLGMFGRPHRALGSAIFTAKKTKLMIGNCADIVTDGVLMELENNPAFHMQLNPVSLASTGALFHFSATGTSMQHQPYSSPGFLGPLGIENQDGEKRLRMDVPGTNAWSARVVVFDGANRSGEFITTGGLVGSFGTNDLDIVSIGVTGGTEGRQATLMVEFREPATLTAAEHILRGNIVHVSPLDPLADIATFASFQVLAENVPFTITNETATITPPVILGIERAGTNVVVSYPSFSSPYSYLEASDALAGGSAWYYAGGETLPANGSSVRKRFPINHPGSGFFRLANYYALFGQ
jgi:hypothetical protein